MGRIPAWPIGRLGEIALSPHHDVLDYWSRVSAAKLPRRAGNQLPLDRMHDDPIG